MEQIKEILDKTINNNIVSSCIVVLISLFIYELLNRLIFKKQKGNIKISNRNKTYIKVLSSIVRYSLIIITILVILQINGVNVNSILAGAGIIGIIVGFAVQDALKDIIRGMIILTDAYFSVGDVVQYGEITGKVISTGLNTTKIQDIRTENIISIANRNIEQIQIVSDSLDIIVPLSYDLPLDEAESVLYEIIEEVKQIEEVTNCSYKGISSFKDSNIDYYINIHCAPVIKKAITRQVNGIILRNLEKNNIKIPYNQLEIHRN